MSQRRGRVNELRSSLTPEPEADDERCFVRWEMPNRIPNLSGSRSGEKRLQGLAADLAGYNARKVVETVHVIH